MVGLERAFLAGILVAVATLWATRQPLPSRKQLGSLAIVTAGVILGFPLLSAWAMQRLPAAHGAVVLGGWQTISWALVLAAPVVALPVAIAVLQHGIVASPVAWLGFAYVSIVSQFLAFFAWYHGLAILASTLLLGE